MKKLLFLGLVVLLSYWIYGRFFARAFALRGLEFPHSISFKTISRTHKGDKKAVDLRTVTIFQNGKWREEADVVTEGKPYVAVFDGRNFGCSALRATVDRADPIKMYRQIFDGLARAQYKGNEVIDGHLCSHFKDSKEGTGIDVWIDRETKFLFRVNGTVPDGSVIEEQYTVLPINQAQYSDLFNTSNLALMFRDYLSAH